MLNVSGNVILWYWMDNVENNITTDFFEKGKITFCSKKLLIIIITKITKISNN